MVRVLQTDLKPAVWSLCVTHHTCMKTHTSSSSMSWCCDIDLCHVLEVGVDTLQKFKCDSLTHTHTYTPSPVHWGSRPLSEQDAEVSVSSLLGFTSCQMNVSWGSWNCCRSLFCAVAWTFLWLCPDTSVGYSTRLNESVIKLSFILRFETAVHGKHLPLATEGPLNHRFKTHLHVDGWNLNIRCLIETPLLKVFMRSPWFYSP